MNGWTAAVLVADVLGVAVAVVYVLRRADQTDRGLRLGGVALTGVLVAFIALRADTIPFLVVLVLVALAVLSGVWFRPEIIKSRGWKFSTVVPLGTTPFVVPLLAVVITVAVWPAPDPPTAEERETTRFGVKIDHHLDKVPVRVLERTPTVTDAGVGSPLAKAVPIEKYAQDGQLLTLVVLHNGTCEPVAVLVAPAGAGLEVAVVASPYPRWASDPPTAFNDCRIDPSYTLAGRTAVGITLPDGLTASSVRDVGAAGPALAVR
jgi:hypothetical protein